MRLQARLERIGEDRHWGDLYKKIKHSEHDKADLYLQRQRLWHSSGLRGVVGRSWLVTRTAEAVLLSLGFRGLARGQRMRPRRRGWTRLTNRTLVRGSTSRIGSMSMRGPSVTSLKEGGRLEVRPGKYHGDFFTGIGRALVQRKLSWRARLWPAQCCGSVQTAASAQ